MQVDLKDGRCRTCGSGLCILDADDATMTVECNECGDNYDVEPDAFGDGCVTYYFPIRTKQLLGDNEEDA